MKGNFRFHQVEEKRARGGRGEMNLNLIRSGIKGLGAFQYQGSTHLPEERVFLFDPLMEKEDHSEEEERDGKRV